MFTTKAIVLLSWTFVAMVAFVNAAAFPSMGARISTSADILRRQGCTGPEDISHATVTFDTTLISGPARTEDCMRLLQELQDGVREAKFRTFYKRFGRCQISWNDETGIKPGDVTFDDLVAPLAVIISRGSSEGGTFGGIENYLLGGKCTDILVAP